jgi:hypothetical protein
MSHFKNAVRCPECQSDWPTGTEVCIECGYNFRTGKKLKTKVKLAERELARGGTVFLGDWSLHARRNEDGELIVVRVSRWWSIPLFRTVWNLTGYNRLVTDYHVTGEDANADLFYLDAEGPKRRTIRLYAGGDQEAMHAIIDGLKELGTFEVTRR